MTCQQSSCDCCPKYAECFPMAAKFLEGLDRFDHDRKAKREQELEDRG